MITTEPISARALRITVPEKVKAEDFQQLAPQIDSLIRQQGKIRLLIDATNFSGWENIAAFEKHIGFINNHHQKVERIVNPEVRAYDKGEESEALAWITG